MTKKTVKKRGFARKLLRGLLYTLTALIVVWLAVSLVGRVKPAAVLPESYAARVRIPHLVRLVERVLTHESLPELVRNPALAPMLAAANVLRENVLQNRLLRFLAQGSVEAALVDPGSGASGAFIAAWDSGWCAPLLRLFPFASQFVSVPNLYYVQAGKFSRFEYRMDGGGTLFFAPRRNLLIVSNVSTLFESAVSGGLNAAAPGGDFGLLPGNGNYDINLLVSPAFAKDLLAGQNPSVADVLKTLELSGMAEAGISILPIKVELHLAVEASSRNTALGHILDRRSQTPVLADRLPAATQYSTLLAAGTLAELYDAAAVFSGPELSENTRRADRAARTVLSMSLEELLYSWSGTEFAVFGMEGRPHPVFAVQVADERKREEVFRKAFRTIVLNENVHLNLDGERIPRIEIPDYLLPLLRNAGFRVASPCYMIHDGYLLLCESAETLLSAVRAMRKNDVLPKTAAWRNLAGGTSSAAYSGSFSLYYSLDRSLPFFLRGNTNLSAFLGVYRQGLARLDLDRGQIRLSVQAVPGSGRGIALMPGYPLPLGGNAQNRVYWNKAGKASEYRIFLAKDSGALSVNPADNSIHELGGQPQGQFWVIPAEGLNPKTAADPGAWVVNVQGRVTLVNGNMEPARGFPLPTGLRLSAPPAAGAGKLILCDEDGKVYTVDTRGTITAWETSFAAAVRSPPTLLTTGKNGRTLAAVYPKSFFGEIWLLAVSGGTAEVDGTTLPNWPVSVSDIAFGSPLLFMRQSQVYTAFVTQAGELSVFTEAAIGLPSFPLNLEGVFYVQPVFDGEYLWLASADGTLFQVSLTGEILRQRIPNFSVREEGALTLFDTDGDKTPEVFITGEGNALHGYSRSFRSLEGFPLPAWGKPLFADLNSDGKIECIAIGMDNLLYRWQFK